MGLAAPRKRTKLSNDPRNLAWSNAEGSYGQRLMQSQGWSAGQALGAKSRNYGYTQAASLKISIKDNTLGLGASLKSQDIANQQTGLDAFQGLLGRLNAKDEAELEAVETKIENKKLAMYAHGRWGGMVFVPGGILVQSDPFKQKVDEEKEEARQQETHENVLAEPVVDKVSDKAARKAEKEKRREARRLRKEQKLLTKVKDSEKELGLPTPDSSSANEAPTKSKTRSKKRARSPEPAPTTVAQPQSRNGRHLLRGKNINAKRAAFSDMKGLDEIFMKVG